MNQAIGKQNSDTCKVNINASNFIMTIRSWLIGLKPPAAGSGASRWQRQGTELMLNSFALERADMVVCFLWRCEMTLSGCEDLGLCVVEMTPDLFIEEYKYLVLKKSKKKKRKRGTNADGHEMEVTRPRPTVRRDRL